MAAAAPAASGGAGGAWPAAAATSRFAAACGALSQYVKAAEAERLRRPLPLMPGADVDGGKDPAAGPALPAQMTIVYGERVLVLDGVPADRAAGLLRFATAAARGGEAAEPPRSGVAPGDLLPVARKASLQRFMEKRKVRADARAEPYSRPDCGDACTVTEDHLKLALRFLCSVTSLLVE